MAKFSIKIKGLDQLQKKLNKQSQKQIIKKIGNEFQVSAQKVRNSAIGRVPVDQGYLRNSINVEGKDLLWIVYASAGYAGYQEFGTKTKVDVPAEMQSEAEKFRNGKLSEGDFKKAIAEWMKRKGIPKEALWPIMAKIMKVGVNPQPFMHPGFKDGTKGLEKRIEDILKDYL
ncbi:HK97-gp10 family putative phage morphogenesis protein [Sphingobacterium humi]|uniref:HK97 gp10 family phage protein n=1 Tax=Sphingobacterium humi TaxID=1796905 RepID=A0A6N8KYF5_9SPHI|nr:HK97-gp10 family putative phage morphogenesis protein [Sphingobacterium humi]MVZ62146.1 hypothetical protein [Sphingobacterium humi]